MIAYLKGKIKASTEGFIILENQGVGYKVFLPEDLQADLVTSAEAELYIYTHVKEDAQDLYGFSDFAQLGLFELLLSVSGIGPKAGLGILAQGDPNHIRQAIANGDSSVFTKISGIGSKTAERIILELQNKVGVLGESQSKTSIGTSADAIVALQNLGYSESESRDLLRNVDVSLKVEDQIKEALKQA